MDRRRRLPPRPKTVGRVAFTAMSMDWKSPVAHERARYAVCRASKNPLVGLIQQLCGAQTSMPSFAEFVPVPLIAH